MGLIIYSGLTSEGQGVIVQELRTLNVDGVESISIEPKNPEWKINLTIHEIRITEKSEMNEIVTILNGIGKTFPSRGIRENWEAKLTLNYTNGKSRSFNVVDSKRGIALFFKGTMGNPKYQLDRLGPLFEHLANFQEPLGGK